MRQLLLTAMAASAIAIAPAYAAFIAIDDSDPFTITITAGDFEDGFSVNGVLLTSGLGSSNSITLPDSTHSFSGTWIDRGLATGVGEILFALPSDPTSVTSGLQFSTITTGRRGTILGNLGGFDGGIYFPTVAPTFPQDGRTEFSAAPFLSISFTSEAVPVPASIALLGAGLAGLGFLRRRS